jgi:hypothetical protein
MNVVRHSTGRQQHSALRSKRSADVLVEARRTIRQQQRFAALRAEDDMTIQASERLRHRAASRGVSRHSGSSAISAPAANQGLTFLAIGFRCCDYDTASSTSRINAAGQHCPAVFIILPRSLSPRRPLRGGLRLRPQRESCPLIPPPAWNFLSNNRGPFRDLDRVVRRHNGTRRRCA